MINNTIFNKYLAKKKELQYSSNGIDYSKVLASEIWRVQNSGHTINFFKSLVNFFIIPDLKVISKILLQYNIVIVSSTIKERPDCQLLLQNVINEFPDAQHLDILDLKRKYYFNLKNLSRAFKVVLKCRKDMSVKQIVHLSSKFCAYLQAASELGRLFSNVNLEDKKIISFHCAISYEALLCQFFNSKNVPTFSLSHGLSFVSYSKEIPYDVIAAENITVGKMLVWGNSSKIDLINHYNVKFENVEVCGNLKYPIKPISVRKTFKSALVLLGRYLYDDSNMEILNILYNLIEEGIIEKVSVKLHPTLNINAYKEICVQLGFELIEPRYTLRQCFESDIHDFAVVNNSVAYFEAMYYDCICFRFEPSENEVFHGLDDKFSNEETLINKIEKFKVTKTCELNGQIKEALVENLGMGIKRYYEVVNK